MAASPSDTSVRALLQPLKGSGSWNAERHRLADGFPEMSVSEKVAGMDPEQLAALREQVCPPSPSFIAVSYCDSHRPLTPQIVRLLRPQKVQLTIEGHCHGFHNRRVVMHPEIVERLVKQQHSRVRRAQERAGPQRWQ